MLRGALLILLIVPLCAAAQPSVAEGFAGLRTGARIVLMRPDVELYEVSGGGVLAPRADWTRDAARFLEQGIRSRRPEVGAAALAPDEALIRVLQLHRAVSSAVVIHHYGRLKLASKAERLDWSLGADAEVLQRRSGADYALFTWVRDSYASPARKAAMVVAALVGMGASGGAQLAYASLVDLRTGRLVWFNRISRLRGDLRDAAGADETLDALLADFPAAP